MHELLKTWKEYQPDAAPFVLPGDEALLRERKLFCRIPDWNNFISNPDFGAPENTELHLDLLPIPFIGSLMSASVYLLMLNPGFGPHDYFGEYCVPEYRSTLIENMHQARASSFMFLDPRFSWHGGFDYWHSKLCELIKSFSQQCDVPYGKARNYFQKNIAAIELVPYHSVNFTLPQRVLNKMQSVSLAQAFVHDNLVQRARSDDCLIIVTRAVKHWQLPVHRNIVTYSAVEARSAHLTSKSRGGHAIMRFLRRQYKQARLQLKKGAQ